MDRQALAARNQALAAAYHTLAFRHRLRRALVDLIAFVPVERGPVVTNPERILLIRPDHLGDVLLTTPAIRAVRRARPQAELHALTGPWSAEVLAGYTDLDLILTLPFPGFTRAGNLNLRSPYELVWRAARQLRHLGYSTALILRPDHWWGALLAYLAGIPRRIGYDLPGVAPFLTDAVVYQHQHVVKQSARLVETMTGNRLVSDLRLDFPVSQIHDAWVEGYLREWGISRDQPIIAIHPGSGTPTKLWQEQGWVTVADTLADQLDAAVVFTGGDHELPLVKRIVAQLKERYCVMVGETQVGALAALYRRARLVLGPDSGPLHLAVAVATPTVTLFGPADPVEFGPWGAREKHRILASTIGCRPCRVLDWSGDKLEHHPCVREISVAQVLDAAYRALASVRSFG